jgi:hypothetical protein
VRGIQKSLFRQFTKLKSLGLEVYNFNEVINSSKNWLSSLNSDLNINLSDMNDFNNHKDRLFKLHLTDLNKTYEFPEKDFCLFKDFPHEKLILPIINTQDNLPCSCSLLWLLQHKKLYDSMNGENLMNTPSTRACFSLTNFDDVIDACDFEEKVESCYEKSKDNIIKVSYLYYLFVVFLSATTFALVIVIMVVLIKNIKGKRKNSYKPQEPLELKLKELKF